MQLFVIYRREYRSLSNFNPINMLTSYQNQWTTFNQSWSKAFVGEGNWSLLKNKYVLFKFWNFEIFIQPNLAQSNSLAKSIQVLVQMRCHADEGCSSFSSNEMPCREREFKFVFYPSGENIDLKKKCVFIALVKLVDCLEIFRHERWPPLHGWNIADTA